MRTHWRVIRNDLHGILPPCWVSSAHIVLAVRQRRRALLTFVRAGFVTIRAKLTASALALALIGATYPAMAGGLGRMHVQSALGQPFRAEIDITGVRSQELSQIRVNIASPAAFAEMQMDYPEVLQGVSVNVVRKPDGKMVARVQGAQPISDPFLFLLLELNDGGARSFKEFTALLEPSDKPTPAAPAVSTEQAKPAASAAPAPAAPAATPAPAPATSKPADSKPAAKAAASKPDDDGPLPSDGRQHTVKPGETLSGVAAKLKPADVSLEQMMVGLYRNNSGAFAGDMNKLRAGATLDVPAADGVRSIPPRDALDTVRAQVKDWRNYVLGGADAAAAAPARDPGKTRTPPSDASAEVAPQDNKEGVLKLSKADGKPGEERAGQLEEELVSREKALKDANERITTLEAQLEEMRGLLALRSQMGAEAEKQAKEAEAGKAEAPPRPASGAQASASEGQHNAMFLLGGLGLAGALLAGVLYAHRRKDTFRRWWEQLMAARRKKAEEKAAEKTAKADSLAASTEPAPAAAAADSNDEDPLVVADRLIEYNKLAQAETVLLDALNKTPDRHELRLKLLKVYYAMPLVDKFNAQAARLLDAVSKTSPLWVQALEMGRKLDPNHPLYAAPKPVEPAASDDFGFDEADIEPAPEPAPAPKPAAKPAPAPVAEDPFDLDSDLLPDDAVMQGGGSFTQDPSDEEPEEKPLLDYDFQMDKDKKPAPEAPAKPAAPAAADSLSMDDVFDFGLDAPAEPAPAPAAAKPAAPAPAPAPIADPVADTLSQDDLDDLFAQPAPAPAAKPEPAPVNDVLSQDDLDNLFGETPAAAEPAADDGELDIDALIAAEQAKQAEEEAAQAAAIKPAPSKPAIPSGDELSLDFDGIFEDTVPPLPALDPEALAAALANAPDMDDLPPPDDTVLEAPDMPLEIPDEGVLAAELAEPELPEGDNPLKDEMSEPSPLLTGDMANIDPDLAFDFDAVFQDAAPAAPKLDRSALAAALASAPDLEELHQEDAVTADSGEAVTPEQVDTKLDLARVYIDMGDEEGAREILVEVMAEGTDEQRNTALKLMEKL
jgi:pilus assembly protein FimV